MVDSNRILSGVVDWSGDNSGIYLKTDRDGVYVSLASLFRVVISPHGQGHALVLIELPEDASEPPRLSLCLNDNEPLARWLVQDYLRHFQQFAGMPALDALNFASLDEVRNAGDGVREHVEIVQGAGIEVGLRWSRLGTPFMVTLAPQHSATGKHAMYSVFVAAGEADITVNGRKLAGKVQPRDYQGRSSTTSFLAFSETWVRD